MKVSELFEVIAKGAVSLRGKTHKGCGGKFEETSQLDDMDGVLHCTKCKKEVQSRVQPAELKKLTEGFEAELADAVKLNWLSWSVSDIVKLLKKQIKVGKWPELKGKSDDELHDYVDSAKDNARNQVDEDRAAKGMWVIKNKDGVEKRFKDDESPEAKAWKESSKKRAPAEKGEKAEKAEKYSQEWWHYKEFADVTPLPWTRLRDADISDEIDKIVKDQFGNITTDYTFGKMSELKRDGVDCAAMVVRVMYEVTPEDDLGVEETVQDSQSILVARNPKNPKKIDFVKFVG